MKKLIMLVVLGSLFLIGCERSPAQGYVDYGYVIPKENQEKAAKFIEATSAAANPKSDEEGEDLVKQVEKTALKIYGKMVIGIYYGGDFTPYDELAPVDKKRCDDYGKVK